MNWVVSADRVLTESAVVTDGAVWITDERIAAVGPRAQVLRQAGEHVPHSAFPGGTVLPGLIDAHVHLAFDASPDPIRTLTDTDDEDLLLAMSGRAQAMLHSGVTTTRDLGDRHGLALRLGRAIEAGVLAGPRVVSAGTPLTSVGGHCGFLGGEVDGPHAIEALIETNAAAGAAVIKVMATGGGLTKTGPPIWRSQFTTDQLTGVVRAAHARDLPVAAHVHGAEGIASAVEAGVDTLEHCTWAVEDGFAIREDVVEKIAERGIFVCCGASPNWRRFAERLGRERFSGIVDSRRRMLAAGVRFIAGTDAGVPGATCADPVGSLSFFSYLGVRPADILNMATRDAAVALRVDQRTGTLAAGRSADLLVVAGDPLRDLDALREVELVTIHGRPHTPSRVPTVTPS